MTTSPAIYAQIVAAQDFATRIEAVEVTIINPSADAAVNARIIDLIRKEVRSFPDAGFSRAATDVALAHVRRTAPVAETSVTVTPGATGG